MSSERLFDCHFTMKQLTKLAKLVGDAWEHEENGEERAALQRIHRELTGTEDI